MLEWIKHPEMEQFLKDFIPGHSGGEIREAFLNEYGITLTKSQIKNFKSSRKIPSGTNGGRFEKGHPSWNKGRKMPPELYKKCAPTMFKKGHVPINHKEVGSERINVDGYTEVKVAEPNKWRLKQRVLYEQYHHVELTRSEVVIFLDGNRLNFDKFNLQKLSRSALARYNQDKLHDNSDRELSRAAAQIATIKALKGQMINEK